MWDERKVLTRERSVHTNPMKVRCTQPHPLTICRERRDLVPETVTVGAYGRESFSLRRFRDRFPGVDVSLKRLEVALVKNIRFWHTYMVDFEQIVSFWLVGMRLVVGLGHLGMYTSSTNFRENVAI